jgi:hypothetical protein
MLKGVVMVRVVNPRAREYFRTVVGTDVIPIIPLKGKEVKVAFDALNLEQKESWLAFVSRRHGVPRKVAESWVKNLKIPKDGVRIFTGVSCVECGKPIPKDIGSFCPFCGARQPGAVSEAKPLYRCIPEGDEVLLEGLEATPRMPGDLNKAWVETLELLRFMHTNYGLEEIRFDTLNRLRIRFRKNV